MDPGDHPPLLLREVAVVAEGQEPGMALEGGREAGVWGGVGH